MTESLELRLTAALAQMEKARRPEWQLWIFVGGVIFYAGISFIMGQQNSAAIEKILLEHKSDMKSAATERSGIEDSLIAHINEENIRNLQQSEQIRKRLEEQLNRKQ